MSTDLSSISTETFDPTVLAPAASDARTSASVRTPLQNVVNRIRFVWNRVQELVGSFLPLGALFPSSLSVSGSTLTLAGHGLAGNDPVRFWSIGGAVPSPLAQFTTYYVVAGSLTANTFQVSATSGGTAITLTTTGTGTIYAAKMTASTFSQILASFAPAVGIAYTRVSNSLATAIGTAWTFTITTWSWQCATTTSTNVLLIPLDESALPNGVTLSSVAINIQGSGTDAALPALMPALSIWRVPITGGTTVQLGSTATDTSTPLAAYQALHSITVTGIAATVDRSQYIYYAQLRPESSTNATSGMLAFGASVTWTGSGNAIY